MSADDVMHARMLFTGACGVLGMFSKVGFLIMVTFVSYIYHGQFYRCALLY